MTLTAIALVGNPNVGKSVLFHRLTGAYVNVSNYPGTTVEVARAAARFDAAVDLIDTPGVLTLPARSDDERATMRALLYEPLRAVIQVGDAKNLRRSLTLTALLADLGLPTVLALNMHDEAGARGMTVDASALSAALGAPVIPTVATGGEGVAQLTHHLPLARSLLPLLHYDAAAEAAIAELTARIAAVAPHPRLAARGLAILYLGQDKEVEAWLQEAAGEAYRTLTALREAASASGVTPAALAHERGEAAGTLAACVTARNAQSSPPCLGEAEMNVVSPHPSNRPAHAACLARARGCIFSSYPTPASMSPASLIGLLHQLKGNTMAVKFAASLTALAAVLISLPATADENLLGYIAGAETLPQGASDAYFITTRRWDKGRGEYTAYDYSLEYEHGLTHRLTGGIELKGQSIDASGLVIDGYMPGAENYGVKASGIEAKLKYNFLSPAKDDLGLSTTFSLQQNWLDPHSGKDKDVTKFELGLQLQKLLLEDQLSLMLNTGLEGTYAKRAALDSATQASADAEMQALTDDPSASFEWPTEPEMELEFKIGGGAAYRVAPNWYVGAEALYETEFETEVGQERWSVFAGPSIHYGGQKWWATLTWFEQLAGGKEQYINQADDNLHLIEKTKHELRLKLGYNF